MVKDLNIDLNEFKDYLVSCLPNSEISLITAEGVKYLSLYIRGNFLFDLRITDSIIEMYVSLGYIESEELIKALSNYGFSYIDAVVNELQSEVKHLPKSLIISWSKPSNSIYILLEPSTNFPPVKGVLRGNDVTVITPSCIIRGDIGECTDETQLLIAKVVIKLLKESIPNTQPH